MQSPPLNTDWKQRTKSRETTVVVTFSSSLQHNTVHFEKYDVASRLAHHDNPGKQKAMNFNSITVMVTDHKEKRMNRNLMK